MKARVLSIALGIGIAVPFLYFGTQIIAAPFFPGYSFLSMDASTLGSDLAIYPSIFNIGAIVTGVATIIASAGFLVALQQLGANPLLAWLAASAITLNGFGSLWAGCFPLPDPRHDSNPFAVGIFLFPTLMTLALWRHSSAAAMKTYLIATHLVFIGLIPIMSGVSGLDTRGYQGLLQRIAALVLFVPIGVSACFLIKHFKNASFHKLENHGAKNVA